MTRSTRAYLRIAVFTGGATFAACQVPGMTGNAACLAGIAVGLAAACVPWRRPAWLRLQVAALLLFGGRDLVYLAVDYRAPEPEAPAVPLAWRAEHERLCRQCDELALAVRDEKARIRESVAAERAVRGHLAALGIVPGVPREGQ